MGSNMHNGTARATLPEERSRGLAIQHGTRSQLLRNYLRLLHSKLQATIVRDTQHERVTQARLLRLATLSALAANFPQRSRRQVGDIQTLYNILRSVKETMERQIVQHSIGYDNQVFAGIEYMRYWPEQQIIEFMQYAQAVIL